MELASLASEVRLANTGETSAFTMESNEFAFRVLSDGLYQNKIGSMVREVSCNALDSHVAAGIPETPIVIHLPDAMEPYFAVQDFGVGLDDAGVRNTFATYFKSTKRSDNTAVGAFGLGSKTPFAYTDAFSITAIKDGVKRIYSAFLAEGVPAITAMSEEPSEEPNGVTITVPVVSSGDFLRFRIEVQNQLAFFDVKPVIENYNGVLTWMDFTSAEAYMNLDRILVGEYNYGRNFSGLWVVQGPVGYKADVELIKQHVVPENREFLDIIAKCAILKFNLGDIEVTPSREGLSYSKKTIAAIEALLDEGRAKMATVVQAQVDAFGTDGWKAATAINSNDTLRRLAYLTKANFDFPGYFRTGQFAYVNLEWMANVQGVEEAEDDVTADVDAANEEDGIVGKLNLQFVQYIRQSYGRRGRSKKWVAGKPGRVAKADDSLVIIIRDTSHKATVRIREFMGTVDGYSKQVFVLQTRFGAALSEDDIKTIKARMGDSWKPRLLSNVPLPARETSGYRAGYKCPTAYTYTDSGSSDATDTTEWVRETDKLSEFEGAYYVIVDRCRTNASGKDKLVFEMADAGLLDKPVMAIRRKDADKLADNPNWVPVSVKAREIIEAVKGNKTLINAHKLSQVSDADVDFMDSDVANLLRKECLAGNVHPDSPLHRLFRVSDTLGKAKRRAKLRGYNRFVARALEYAGVYVSGSDMQDAINKRAEKLTLPVKTMHPLLPFLRSTGYRAGYKCPTTEAAAILAYVNATTGA